MAKAPPKPLGSGKNSLFYSRPKNKHVHIMCPRISIFFRTWFVCVKLVLQTEWRKAAVASGINLAAERDGENSQNKFHYFFRWLHLAGYPIILSSVSCKVCETHAFVLLLKRGGLIWGLDLRISNKRIHWALCVTCIEIDIVSFAEAFTRSIFIMCLCCGLRSCITKKYWPNNDWLKAFKAKNSNIHATHWNIQFGFLFISLLFLSNRT